MWKNKHLITALLVAPILAVIAYLAVDYTVSERPHAARAGASYPLLAKSNCRYASGRCEIENGDVKLVLTAQSVTANVTVLQLNSALPLHGATVALARDSRDLIKPLAMRADNDSATEWSAELSEAQVEGADLRLAVSADRSQYFAQVPTVFFVDQSTLTR